MKSLLSLLLLLLLFIVINIIIIIISVIFSGATTCETATDEPQVPGGDCGGRSVNQKRRSLP